MDMDPKVFLDVPLNVRAPHKCSPPDPGPYWHGVVIRAPTQVKFKRGETAGDYGAFAAIPICAFFRVQARLTGINEPMKLVAIDKRTGQTFSGPIVELDPSPVIPPPDAGEPLDAEELEGTGGGGYFNSNLADFVTLPPTSASYDVHIQFREYKSNVVTIELVETT